MATPYNELTDTQIRDADFIVATGPHVPNGEQQLWGQWSVPPLTPRGAPPHRTTFLEVTIDSPDQYEHVASRTETLKGHLPPGVSRKLKPK